MTGKLISLFVVAAVIGFLGYMLYEHFKGSPVKLNAAATVASPAPADVTAQLASQGVTL